MTTFEQAREWLDRWARYCHKREDGGTGWPKKVMLGRLQDGMPGTNCPRCAGTGRVRIEAPGIALAKAECPICGGSGRVDLVSRGTLANPALILPTGSKSYDDDPIAQKLDWIICAKITEDSRIIIRLQYLRNGNQTHKARRLGISQGEFSKRLQDAMMEVIEFVDSE